MDLKTGKKGKRKNKSHIVSFRSTQAETGARTRCRRGAVVGLYVSGAAGEFCLHPELLWVSVKAPLPPSESSPVARLGDSPWILGRFVL